MHTREYQTMDWDGTSKVFYVQFQERTRVIYEKVSVVEVAFGAFFKSRLVLPLSTPVGFSPPSRGP